MIDESGAWWQARLREADRMNGIVHRDDVAWHEAPLPPRRHRCWAQTERNSDGLARCACGALRFEGAWLSRNERQPERLSLWRRIWKKVTG